MSDQTVAILTIVISVISILLTRRAKYWNDRAAECRNETRRLRENRRSST